MNPDKPEQPNHLDENAPPQTVVSVVVPLFNEEDNVQLMFEAIDNALRDAPFDYEILFVDDGSSDRTAELVTELTDKHKHLIFIRFRRNYGQTPAMAAGIDHARGNIVVTMDGDLQNDPLDIPEMVAQIGEDVDMVVGWRVKRQDKLITRKIPSIIANRLIGKVTGVPIRDNGCSLKAYKADVIKRVPLYSELHRFIPAMASITGARVKQVPVRHHARQFGESKYGLGRIYRVLFDLLIVKTMTQFAARPLKWFSILGIIPLLLSIPVGVALISEIHGGGDGANVMTAVFGQLIGLSLFMVMCGGIGELVFRSADVKPHELPMLTAASRITTNLEQ